MRAKPVVVATVAIVVVTTLASGPLLSLVDLTAADTFSGAGLGEGRATVEDATLPDRVTIERGEFGAESYYLRVPAANVRVADVVGRPILSYRITVPELGFTASRIYVLSAGNEGTMDLTLDDRAFPPDEIAADSYEAEVSVDVRYGGSEHVVGTNNVTIEVVG